MASPTVRAGREGRGTVHHVAVRTPTDDDRAAMRSGVAGEGLRPTRRIDRHRLRSVYVREHDGVPFELAADGPGYAGDEPPDDLGSRPVLPGEFAERREEIEAGPPDIAVPGRAHDADARPRRRRPAPFTPLGPLGPLSPLSLADPHSPLPRSYRRNRSNNNSDNGPRSGRCTSPISVPRRW